MKTLGEIKDLVERLRRRNMPECSEAAAVLEEYAGKLYHEANPSPAPIAKAAPAPAPKKRGRPRKVVQ